MGKLGEIALCESASQKSVVVNPDGRIFVNDVETDDAEYIVKTLREIAKDWNTQSAVRHDGPI